MNNDAQVRERKPTEVTPGGGAFEERYRLGAKTRKTFIQSTNEMCVRQDEGE